MKQSTEIWLKAADDDLMTIQSILHREELTNIVAFHAQQAIEKSFKAILEEFDFPVIRTHNLETLFLKITSRVTIEINDKVIAELDKLYLDSRYPGDLGILPSGKPTVQESTDYFIEASKIQSQVEGLLST
jgi:HEPN domain-containing protein